MRNQKNNMSILFLWRTNAGEVKVKVSGPLLRRTGVAAARRLYVVAEMGPAWSVSPLWRGLAAVCGVGHLYADELDHVATNLDRLNESATGQANGQEPDKTTNP